MHPVLVMGSAGFHEIDSGGVLAADTSKLICECALCVTYNIQLCAFIVYTPL